MKGKGKQETNISTEKCDPFHCFVSTKALKFDYAVEAVLKGNGKLNYTHKTESNRGIDGHRKGFNYMASSLRFRIDFSK